MPQNSSKKQDSVKKDVVRISINVAIPVRSITSVVLGSNMKTGIYLIGMGTKGFNSDFDLKTTIDLLNQDITYDEAKASVEEAKAKSDIKKGE